MVHRLSMIKTIEFFSLLTGVFITTMHFYNNALHLYLHICQLSHFQLDNSHFSYLFLAVTYIICLVHFVCQCTLMHFILDRKRDNTFRKMQLVLNYLYILYFNKLRIWVQFNLEARHMANHSIFWLLVLHQR